MNHAPVERGCLPRVAGSGRANPPGPPAPGGVVTAASPGHIAASPGAAPAAGNGQFPPGSPGAPVADGAAAAAGVTVGTPGTPGTGHPDPAADTARAPVPAGVGAPGRTEGIAACAPGSRPPWLHLSARAGTARAFHSRREQPRIPAARAARRSACHPAAGPSAQAATGAPG